MTEPTKRAEIVHIDIEIQEPERVEDPGQEIELGSWWWVDEYDEAPEGEDPEDFEKPELWLGCITHIGSNYVKVTGPKPTHGERYADKQQSIRVHLNEFDEYLTRELDPQSVIEKKVGYHREEVKSLMQEVANITKRLGVSPRQGLPGPVPEQSESYALATLNDGGMKPKDYKNALIKAKEEDLPALFEQIKANNCDLAIWMQAETIPMMAQVGQMQGCVKLIEGRIFNVSLYAGLTEDVTQFADGEPAGFDEKLHLMQRRCYMDEECLLDYQTGGMEFDGIAEFDEWMARPKNRNRLLPFPRAMIAMRVRRNKKDRGPSETIGEAFVKIELAELDKLTFLYIRNGEQLFRMNCDLEFGEMIFPDKDEFDPSQPMMFKGTDPNSIDLITVNDYETRVEDYRTKVKAAKKWKRDNPFRKWKAAWVAARRIEGDDSPITDKTLIHQIPDDKSDTIEFGRYDMKYKYRYANPYTDSWEGVSGKPKGWKRLTPENVYYDEVVENIGDRVQHYNRIALIIQGLYDRSAVLHPHPPVKTWDPAGFEAAIELVYDGSHCLYAGEEPDFNAYRDGLRESLDGNSVVIGQQCVWVAHVQEKEDRRRADSYNHRNYRDVPPCWTPDGNDGPGELARVARFQRNVRKAIFRWYRERGGKGWRGSSGDLIIATYSVDTNKLFNVSAYKPGDYLQFFQDPRTRQDYLRWADLMLTAEEFHAGNLKPQEPAVKDKSEPKLVEMATRIEKHLKRFEDDKKINKWRDNYPDQYRIYKRPRAWKTGRFIQIEVHRSFNGSSLTKGEAWKYLKWLDDGGVGRYHEVEA